MSERNRSSTPEERMLEEYLKGGSDVSRSYRESASESVPPILDERVLAMARAAAGKRKKSHAWMRWTAPLAAAASAVVVLSVVMDQGAREQAAVTAIGSRPAPVPKAAESQAAESQAATVRKESESRPAASGGVHEDTPPQSPAVAPPSRRDEEVFFAPAALPPQESVVREEREQARQEESRQARRQKAVDGSREERSFEQIVVTGSRRRETAADDAVSVAPQTAAIQRVDARSIIVPAPVAAIDTATDSAESAGAAANAAPTDPEEWLKAIRRLREQSKAAEADREWNRFREAFPDYAVPENDRARPPSR